MHLNSISFQTSRVQFRRSPNKYLSVSNGFDLNSESRLCHSCPARPVGFAAITNSVGRIGTLENFGTLNWSILLVYLVANLLLGFF